MDKVELQAAYLVCIHADTFIDYALRCVDLYSLQK